MARFLFPIMLILLICPVVSAVELSDTVISGQQTWGGDVHISGVVRVTREGQLTILPGTRILFARKDLDGDGIGDGELLVEGRIIAIGDIDRPILFSSSEADPQPGDWKFLYLDYARRADLRHIVSEYAFSGIQVHFCKATIEGSEFRNNIDGVRFSTANIQLTHSNIHHNRHGIRFEERGGKGFVRGNRISANDVGIFAVTRAEGRTLFELNDITENSPYQVKMGLQQHEALDFPRNWWGDVSGLSEKTVFDQRQDRSLGRVTGSQPLSGPVTDFGVKE